MTGNLNDCPTPPYTVYGANTKKPCLLIIMFAFSLSQDIFRRYPNKYESIISTLCENLDSLDEPEAK